MLIGYARCSTDKQDLEANRQILLELGVAAEHIYLDKAYSGTNRARPGLDQALAAVRAGGTVVTPKPRPARPLRTRRPSDRRLLGRPRHSAAARHDDLRPHRPDGQDVLQHPGHLRRVRGRPLRMRTREGMAIARAKGKLKGRAPKLSPARQAHLLKLHAAEEHTIAELAELFEVSRPTVYRVLERHRAGSST
jgi:DNA invertase Pin-like site-specific DNA recombinase